jgi:peptide deformylase
MTLSIEKGTNNPILRQKAKKVKQITTDIKQLVLDMIETLKANNGAGLAAPQIGQPLRIIVAKPDENKEALVLINPQIIKTSRKKEIMEEGCLSLPDISVPVKRAAKITVQGLDINGQTVKIKAKGILARVIQHEIDHLDGILIIDKRNNSMTNFYES